MAKEKLAYYKDVFASFLLRAGLAIILLYAGFSALLNPLAWVAFMPGWLIVIVSPNFFLPTFAVFQILLALWLLSNKFILEAALVTSLILLAIIIFNLAALDIVFRDLTILFACFALLALHYKK